MALKSNPDVIIIGAGASGMVAAIRAAERGKNVLLLEKGDRSCRKVLASGNGRCNLMNTSEPRYYGDPVFAGAVLAQFGVKELSSFFAQYGLVVTEEAEGRIYPLTYHSASVASVLKNALAINGVTLNTRTSVCSVRKTGSCFTVSTEQGCVYTADSVIIASGGPAQPKLGGTADGHILLHDLGHTIVPPSPALVPLTTDRKSISGLSGIRTRCKIRLFDESGSLLHTEAGEILFTDYGISGICVMQCARFTSDRRTYMEADFLDSCFHTDYDLGSELRRRQAMMPSFDPVHLFDGLLQERIAYAVLKQSGIPLHGETAADLCEADLDRAALTARRYLIRITGTRGFDYAQVTSGGADCSEFNPETMESGIVQGLYACGEVLNVDGDCGGFNLMFAFASGLTAGQSV